MMIFLLFPLVFAQMILILILLFRTPLRKLVISGMDSLKRGRGTVVAQTLLATLVVLFGSSLFGIIEERKQLSEGGAVNPTEQVLLAYHLLEATLLGYSLFLSLMIDRLHYYVKEIYRLRKRSEDNQLAHGRSSQVAMGEKR